MRKPVFGFVNNKGADQSAQISAFVVRELESIIYKLYLLQAKFQFSGQSL